MVELANDSKFSGEQTTNTMGTKKKCQSADDDMMQADDNMNGVKPKVEAWRLIHSRYAQKTTEMISRSLLHDSADKHNQLYVVPWNREGAQADGRSRWNTSSTS